jgi:enoyl-CoA hydratase/carnithine racemase
MGVFKNDPPDFNSLALSFPIDHVLLITLNMPERLNALSSWQHEQLESVFRWYDREPSLRCAVVTGAGRSFCAGANLKEWKQRVEASVAPKETPRVRWLTSGFGGLSNRTGKKPVIAAVNGPCMGGGMEMVVNCDLVVAGRTKAKFGLPEVQRGVVASAGSLPRLIRTLGMQRASEMAFLGRAYDSQTMQDWGLVNFVVNDDENDSGAQTGKAVVDEAIQLAKEISDNSPDSIITTREGLRLGWEAMGPTMATEVVGKGLLARMDNGENMKKGLSSFANRSKPRFVNSKL